MKTRDDVLHAREMLEFEVDDYLRSKGWKHTSTTPGCFWLWCKDVEWTTTQRIFPAPSTGVEPHWETTTHKRSVMTDKDTALAIQGHFDDEEAEAAEDAEALKGGADGG